MLFFAAQDALMKTLLLTYPIWILLFIRSLLSVVVLLPLILWLGGPHRLRTALWPLHLLRALLFGVGFTLFYTAFPFMGLAEASTIFFSAPLMIGAMAALFLGEKIGVHRIGALVVGFAGVLIAMNPGGDTFKWIALLPLVCAAFYAASQILARRIGEAESSLTVGFWTLLFSGPIMLGTGWLLNQTITFGPEFHHLRWAIEIESVSALPVLLLLGAAGMGGYILVSRAYQVADASVVAPFDYSYLPIATLLGWHFWGEVPAASTFVGMSLIVASGLYIGYREIRASRTEPSPALVAETIVAPAAPQPVPAQDAGRAECTSDEIPPRA